MGISSAVSSLNAARSTAESSSLKLYQIASLVQKLTAPGGDEGNFDVEFAKQPVMESLVGHILKDAMSLSQPTPAQLASITFMLGELQRIAPQNVHSVACVAAHFSASSEVNEIFEQAQKENTPGAYEPTSPEAARKEAEETENESPSYWTRGLGVGLIALVTIAGGTALYQSLQNGAPKAAEPSLGNDAPVAETPSQPVCHPSEAPSLDVLTSGLLSTTHFLHKGELLYLGERNPKIIDQAKLPVISSFDVIKLPRAIEGVIKRSEHSTTCPPIAKVPSDEVFQLSRYQATDRACFARKFHNNHRTSLKKAGAESFSNAVCWEGEAPKLPDSAKQVMIAPSRELVTTPGNQAKQGAEAHSSSKNQCSSDRTLSKREIRSILHQDMILANYEATPSISKQMEPSIWTQASRFLGQIQTVAADNLRFLSEECSSFFATHYSERADQTVCLPKTFTNLSAIEDEPIAERSVNSQLLGHAAMIGICATTRIVEGAVHAPQAIASKLTKENVAAAGTAALKFAKAGGRVLIAGIDTVSDTILNGVEAAGNSIAASGRAIVGGYNRLATRLAPKLPNAHGAANRHADIIKNLRK